MKNNLREYFIFTKKERVGIILLLLISGSFLVLPYFFERKQLPLLDQPLTQELAQLQKTLLTKVEYKSTEESNIPIHLFPFNPNTIELKDWMTLGVKELLAKRILNYRNKGGQFRTPDDLRKIWGMSAEQADQLIPFVVLPPPVPTYRFEKKAPPVIDINTASVEEWKALPGIGESISNRIIKYRERSGGFARMEELTGVFGLQDSVVDQIKPYLRVNPQTVPKSSLNRASAYLLALKTGIPEGVAKEIVRIRMQTGNYADFEELRQVPNLTNEMLQRIRAAFEIE